MPLEYTTRLRELSSKTMWCKQSRLLCLAALRDFRGERIANTARRTYYAMPSCVTRGGREISYMKAWKQWPQQRVRVSGYCKPKRGRLACAVCQDWKCGRETQIIPDATSRCTVPQNWIVSLVHIWLMQGTQQIYRWYIFKAWCR